MKKRFLSILMVLSMCLSMLPVPALAAEDTGLCDHHTAHTAECHYAEAVAGTPCGHEHTAECYTAGVLPDGDSFDVYATGEDTNALNCQHQHDDTCGYVAAVEAHDCHFVCAECAAPVCDCGTDDPAIHATTCAVYVAPENPVCYCAEKCTEVNEWCDVCGFDYTACTGTDTAVAYAEGDKVSVTINGETTYYTSIKDAVAKANESGNATITLLQDTTTGERLDITNSATLDLNGNTLSCTAYFADDYETMVAITTNNTKLTIIDSVGGGKLDGTGTDYALMLGEPGAYTARSASAYIDGSTVSGSVKTVSGTSMTVSGSTVESNSVVATIDMTNETTLNVFNSQILNTHSSSAASAIDNIGTLTITDSTISGSIGVDNRGTANISGNTNITGTVCSVKSRVESQDSTLTITGGNYTGGINITGGTATISGGSYTGGIVVSGGTATISDGTITESSAENAVEVSGSADLTISGGTFSAIAGETYDTGVYVHDGGTVKIIGGTITSRAYGVYNDGGSATITGGTISGGTVDLQVVGSDSILNLTLDEGKTVGATFPGGITVEGNTLAELLSTDTATYWGVVDGKDTMLTVADDAATGITDKGDITIRAICDHKDVKLDYIPTETTHTPVCSVCNWTGEATEHTGGTATCQNPAVCEACGVSYGDKDENIHTPTEGTIFTDNGDGTHSYTCACGAAVAEVPHTLDVTTGKCSACGADMTAIATVTDGTNTYYAADAATLNQAVTAILETGSRTFTVELPADTEAEMIIAIRRATCDTEGVADGSIHLTLKGVTSIPGTTNWDGVAFGPGDIYDEAGEIVDQELVTQLASINLPDVTEIGAQAFYFCENLVSVSAPKAQTIGAQAFGYTALTSVEFPELTTIPTDMFSGTWTLSSAKFPKVTTIEQGGLLVGAKFTPENNPTPFPLELTAEGNITFNGSNHFNIASQNYSGKVDLVLCCNKADEVTKNEDGTATWQVRDDLSYTFKSITFKHSYVDGKCTACGEDCTHTGGTATCTTPAVCEACGVSYGEVDTTNHDSSVECVNGFCPNGCYEPATLNAAGYYEIDNAGKLFWFAQQVNVKGNREIKGVLTAHIDLENKPWTPIGATGEENNNFRGVFDGQNYTIKGLNVEGSENGVGFFGEVRTGTVKNFTIYGNVVVNTEVDYVGGVIGSICGVNGETDLERNGAIIQNITSFVNVTAKAHGIGMIGGFVGYANHQSLIEKCAWYGTFDAGEYRVDSGAGGFIGKIQENTSEVTIRNCGAYGTIKTNYAGDYNNTATIYMGGFLSFSNTNAQTTLENCLFAGRFERGENLTDQAFLGAFGTLRSVKAIKNCYYLGDDGLAAVHSDSNLKPGSDNVDITSVTGEELRNNTIATQLGDHWMQDVHYPIPKDTKAHSDSATYTYTDNGDGTHNKVCSECGYVAASEAHSGGTATCTEQAECQHCGASYGEVGGHSPDAAGYTVNADGTHSYTCSSCRNPFTESHTFTDGACTGCGVIGGYCGEEGNEQNVIWTYANGTLTISGTGAMADQFDNYNNRPWEEYVDQITTIVVNDGITSIGEAAFWRFQKLTTAMLPDSLTTISQQAFYGCTALKTVNFPANLKTIEGWAFLGCALESVTLPEGLTTIGYRAFSECKNLTSVTVPASVTTIDEGAFGYSPAKITVAEDNLNYSSDEHGVLFDKDKTTLIYCRPNIEVETYTIPSTVTEICKEAFYGCKNLATITIPDGVQKIGSSAFGGCEALTTITIPAGVTTIEANTFYDCTALTAVTIPAGVTTIDMWAFSGCTALTTVTIPASVTSIAYNAFSNCSALTTVNVPCTWDGSLYAFDEGVTVNKVHNWTNGTCTVCGVPCDHKDSTHTTSNNNGDGTHSFTCSVCVNTVIEAHTGGTATCTEQAKCEHCGASYGDFAAHSMDYVADEEANTITYRCGTCDTKTVTFTLVIPTGVVYGSSAMAVPHYDCSDKTYQGDSPEITLDGALLKDFVPGAKTYEVVMTWGGKTVSGEYTIAKAEVSITAAPTPNTLTYIGEAQYLISAGEANVGTMVYSLTENGDYTTSIPQGTNAGDYTVWYYVQGDANHKDSAKDYVSVTIEKATVTVTADAKSKPYGTDNPTLTYTSEGLLGDDVLTGALETTATKTSNVGEYDITVGSLANSNYTIDFVGAKLTITKAASSCTAPVAVSSLTFNGGNQNLITAGTATGGTMQYSLDGSNWSETIPTGKDADTYTVYYKVVGDGNHNDADGGSVSVTIDPKVITNPVIEGIDAQYLHTGSAITPVPTAVKDGNTVIDPSEYTLTYENNINEGTATLKIVDVANGNYTVSGSKTFQIVVHAHVWNYSASGNTITATCSGTIGSCPEAEQTIKISAESKTYDGTAVAATLTGSIDGVVTPTISYSGNTNAGTYTASITIDGKTASVEFTISKADQVAPNLNKTDETIKGQKNGTITGVTNKMEYATTSGGSYTAITGTTLDSLAAGTYYVRLAADANHNASPDTAVTIAAGEAITVTYDQGTQTASGMPAQLTDLSYGTKLTKPADPTANNTDFAFVGWYKDAACTAEWDFNADTLIAESVTLYAKWKQVYFSVTAAIKDHEGNEYRGTVEVDLMRGNNLIDSVTGTSGSFQFSKHVEAGMYNLVATYTDNTGEHTKTELINVDHDGSYTLQLPAPGVNSHLDVSSNADTPDVMVGGLDDEAASVKSEADSGSDTVKEVSVTMDVEGKKETQVNDDVVQKIEQAIAEDSGTGSEVSAVVEYLEIKVNKEVVTDSGKTTTPITETTNVIEIVIPFNFSGRTGIKIIRHHGDAAAALVQNNTNGDGTFYLDVQNGYIHIFTKLFSTYAVSYTTSYTITFDVNGGDGSNSTATSKADGTVTLPADPTRSGYTFKGWYTASSGGTKVTSDYVFSGDTTVYAQWTQNYTPPAGGGGYVPSTFSITVEDSTNGTVKVDRTRTSSGTTVTLTVTPDTGYTLETLMVTTSNGKEVELTNKGNGQYTFKMPSGKVTVKATFMDDNTMLNFFVDVPADAYYYDAVLWAAKSGITSGTTATTFSPNNPCTRAQMATFLWRTAGSPEPVGKSNPFTDVRADTYYAKAVQWAYEQGITGGTSATTFSPDDTCTRGQMATFLWRNAGSNAPVNNANQFADVPAEKYYAVAVQWAYEQKITSGTSATTFSPDDPCTRAQMVTFLYRFFVK